MDKVHKIQIHLIGLSETCSFRAFEKKIRNENSLNERISQSISAIFSMDTGCNKQHLLRILHPRIFPLDFSCKQTLKRPS